MTPYPGRWPGSNPKDSRFQIAPIKPDQSAGRSLGSARKNSEQPRRKVPSFGPPFG